MRGTFHNSFSVLQTAFAIYQSLPYFESFGTYSTKLPFDLSIYFPYVLKIYLMMLFIGKWLLFCFCTLPVLSGVCCYLL